MTAKEVSFDNLLSIPVHYDRLPGKLGYGTKGKHQTFYCRAKLRDTLERCFKELFALWGRGTPTIILTAGTIGDGMNAHGQGYAFDLDGFYWGEEKFMMIDYPTDRPFYLGVNAHLFMHFSQVLSYHYPQHRDHFHVDFNFSSVFRPESNAQTFFLQACLKYLFGCNLGNTGSEKDGVDGIFGGDTEAALKEVLDAQGIGTITIDAGWARFLELARERAFSD